MLHLCSRKSQAAFEVIIRKSIDNRVVLCTGMFDYFGPKDEHESIAAIHAMLQASK